MINLASPAIAPELDLYELKKMVNNMYGEVALNPQGQYPFETGRRLAERLGYPHHQLDKIPEDAIASFAGAGYHFDLANLSAGEAVVDLGSGSGTDVFIAAHQVGPGGEVIGIDITPEQLLKSREIQDTGDYPNARFLNSRIEELPIIPNTIDAVISNGTINLSLNKMKVFDEAARILKPGGRLVLSDIVSTKVIPEWMTCDASLWAACIGGVMQVNEYYNYLESAGFMIVKTKENSNHFLSNTSRGVTNSYGIRSVSLLAIKV